MCTYTELGMDRRALAVLLFLQKWGRLSLVAAPWSWGLSLASDVTLPKPLPAYQALPHSVGDS